jgi:hypothetical protein
MKTLKARLIVGAIWKSFNEEPEENRYIHMFKNNEIDIMYYTKLTGWNIKEWIKNDCKWCYVFMPDPPKDEKIIIGSGVINLNSELSGLKLRLDTLSDRIKYLEEDRRCNEHSFDVLENKIEDLQKIVTEIIDK